MRIVKGLFVGIFATLVLAVVSVNAADSVSSAQYLDTDYDGTIDTVRWIMDENVTSCTYESGDWTVNTAGDFNISVTGVTCTGSDANLDILVSADTNETGSSVNPVISYADNGTTGSIVLDSGSMTDKSSINANDKAAPAIVGGAYHDWNDDGEVDRIRFDVSQETSLSCGSFVGNANVSVGTAGDVNVQVSGSDTCQTSANNRFYILLNTLGTTDTTGGTTSPVVSYAALGGDFQDGSGNETPSKASVTLSDAGTPVVLSGKYADLDSDGQVESVVLTTTADTGLTCTSFTGGTDFTIGTAGTVNIAHDAGDACSTNGTNTITITLANPGDVGITGGGTDPIGSYSNPGNGIEDGAANDLEDFSNLSLSDGAAPAILSGKYQDNDQDGDIDRVVLTLSSDTTIICDGFVGGTTLTFDTSGDVNLVEDSADTCATNGTDTLTITLDQEGDSDTTGGSTEPIATFTSVDGVEDAEGNDIPTKSSFTLIDNAAPIITTVQYRDTNQDGEIDQVRFRTTSDSGITCTSFTPEVDFTVDTSGTVELIDSAGDTCATNGTSNFRVNLGTLGKTNTTGGPVDPVVSYTQPGDGVEDGAGNDIPSVASITAVDKAKPLLLTANPGDGATGVEQEVDIDLSFTEAINIGSFVITIDPDQGGFVLTWTNDDIDLNADPVDALNEDTDHLIEIDGEDLNGNSLNGGILPLSWVITPEEALSNFFRQQLIKEQQQNEDQGDSDQTQEDDEDSNNDNNNSDEEQDDSGIMDEGFGGTPGQFGEGLNGEPLFPGSLVKLLETDTVYFIDTNGIRHAFSHRSVYVSWYGADFSDVIDISGDTLLDLPAGDPVTYKPGSVVKLNTAPEVYIVTRGAILRHLASEELAKNILGDNWGDQVIDMNPADFGLYTIGEPINEPTDIDMDSERNFTSDIEVELNT